MQNQTHVFASISYPLSSPDLKKLMDENISLGLENTTIPGIPIPFQTLPPLMGEIFKDQHPTEKKSLDNQIPKNTLPQTNKPKTLPVKYSVP